MLYAVPKNIYVKLLWLELVRYVDNSCSYNDNPLLLLAIMMKSSAKEVVFT